MVAAISHAHKVLDWYENLPKKEIPPEWMWPFDEELDVFFEEVEEARKTASSPSAPDDEDGGPMMSNELSKGMR